MATLRLQMKGEAKAISLRAFLVAMDNSLRVLNELDAAISHAPKGTLDWIVSDLATGSLVLETESRSRIADRNLGPEVASAYLDGIEAVEERGVTPPYLSELGMKRLRQVVKLVGKHGTSGLVVSDLRHSVEITAKASANIDLLLAVRKRSIGSVEGTLETISVHGHPRVIVYHSRTRKAITCSFASPELLRQASALLGRRVRVAGIVHSNVKGEPMRVAAAHIRVLRHNDELPSIEALSGIDPDFTGGLSTEEYLRSMRVG